MLTLSRDLKRYPYRKNDLLQAWDSADELLLAHLDTLVLNGKRILIIGDSFGALSCALKELDITTYTDSFVSAEGIRQNSEGKVQVVNSLAQLSGIYDYALIKIPKNMAYLEDMLARLSAHLAPGSHLIGGAMVKHLAKSAFTLIEKYVGATKTSLAQKKARLIFADFARKKVESPYPTKVRLDGFEKEFTHASNLFSRERLDIGTRFFLEHLPEGDFRTILDLGCGNGAVGIRAKQLNPAAKILFTDESAMAVESARVNYAAYFTDPAEFVWTNGYENREPNSVDLVLCNPPFHQQSTIGDHVAWQMFQDARSVLKKGGLLLVIGNSHLNHGATLKRIFGNSEVVAKNSKFTIADAIL